MKQSRELQLQIAICYYIKYKYKDVIFKSELSGQNTSRWQAIVNQKLRSDKGFCDLEILEPNIKYSGLYLELKDKSPFKKNGELKKNEHLQEQKEMMLRLSRRGYKCSFVWDLIQAKTIIDDYLKIERKKNFFNITGISKI